MAGVNEILEKIGKTALGSIFRQQRIDSIDTCKLLTDDDLKELGMSTIGDRTAFRDAVNNYSVTPPTAEPMDTSSRRSMGGRRGTVTLQNILQFVTGGDEEPVLGYAIKPSIVFALTATSYLPTSNTCINKLNLFIPENEDDMPTTEILFGLFDYSFLNNYFGLQ